MRSSVYVPCLVMLAFASLLQTAMAEGDAERGVYLAALSDCGGGHTPGALTPESDFSRNLAGNYIGYEIPGLGIFFPPNLTNHPENGLGTWSDAEIVYVIRKGVRPDGRNCLPRCPGALTSPRPTKMLPTLWLICVPCQSSTIPMWALMVPAKYRPRPTWITSFRPN